MVETRRRRPASESKPVSRRRDRANDVEEDDEDEDEVDATERPARRTKSKTSTRRRKPDPVDEDEGEDEEEEEAPPRRRKASTTKRRRPPVDEDEDEDEEDEEDEPPRRRKSSAKSSTRRRRPAEDEDDEDEEEEAPRRRRGTSKAKSKLPPGVKTGMAGVEDVRKSGGSGVDRLQLSNTPELFKCLDAEPLLTFRQHWVPQGGGQPDRPYTCPGKKDCPLCDMGDSAGQSIAFNILHLSGSDEPEVKLLQMGIRAFNAFKEAATTRGSDNPRFTKDFFSVARSGKGNQSQTNFNVVKLRDIEEDWDEVLEHWDIGEIDDILAEAEDEKFLAEEVAQGSTVKQLRDVAKFLTED